MEKYNGFKNWETWLISLHFDGFINDGFINDSEGLDAEGLKGLVEEIVFDGVSDRNLIAQDIINIFLSRVYFEEIIDKMEK
jgi:hypothetical protein